MIGEKERAEEREWRQEGLEYPMWWFARDGLGAHESVGCCRVSLLRQAQGRFLGGAGTAGKCSAGRDDVFSFWANVFSFRPDVFTFRPNVFSFEGQVFSEEGKREERRGVSEGGIALGRRAWTGWQVAPESTMVLGPG